MTEQNSLTNQLEQVKERVAKVLELAQSLGADGAEVAMTRTQGLSVGTRLGEVENVEFTNDGALGITVYQNGLKAHVIMNYLRVSNVIRFK